MIQSCQIKVLFSQDQQNRVEELIDLFNVARNFTSKTAWEKKVYNKFNLHKLVYRELRERFSLPSQLACNAIKSVCNAYQLNKTTQAFFKNKSLPLDVRTLSINTKKNIIRIVSLNKWETTKAFYQIGKHQECLFKHRGTEAILVLRNKMAFLHLCCEVPEEPLLPPSKFIGVDLGIVNLATTSEGRNYSGTAIDKSRTRYAKLIARLQSKRTRSCYRKLRKTSGRQARFVRNTNHIISKEIVNRAKALSLGIAMEALHKIETPVKKAQRERHQKWSFYQLRTFVAYKALLQGVRLVLVNPKNTSRRCFRCGHIAKENRKTQSEFRCMKCDFSANADVNAANNIAGLAEASVNRLNVAIELAQAS